MTSHEFWICWHETWKKDRWFCCDPVFNPLVVVDMYLGHCYHLYVSQVNYFTKVHVPSAGFLLKFLVRRSSAAAWPVACIGFMTSETQNTKCKKVRILLFMLITRKNLQSFWVNSQRLSKGTEVNHSSFVKLWERESYISGKCWIGWNWVWWSLIIYGTASSRKNVTAPTFL